MSSILSRQKKLARDLTAISRTPKLRLKLKPGSLAKRKKAARELTRKLSLAAAERRRNSYIRMKDITFP